MEHLRSLGVDYEYINIEQDPAAREWVKKQNGGKEKKPTVKIQELDQELAATGML